MKTLITALGFAFISETAIAASPTFSAADADGNGSLSLEEVKAALPEVDEAKIVAADANNDGRLDEAEYTTLTSS